MRKRLNKFLLNYSTSKINQYEIGIKNQFLNKKLNINLTTYLIDNIISFMIYQCLYLKYVCFRVMFGPDFWVYDVDEISNNKNQK